VFGHPPDTRQSLLGVTAEGDEAWLIGSISQRLHRCPGCHGEIGIGEASRDTEVSLSMQSGTSASRERQQRELPA
jgi:hypothetical protein